MFSDYKRDMQMNKEVYNCFENYKEIDMDKIRELRAKYSSARYFKDTKLELKLIDFHIRVLIHTYHKTNKCTAETNNDFSMKLDEDDLDDTTKNIQSGQAIIDFGKVKELYLGVKLQERLSEKIVKKENVVFITKLYKKCKEMLKKDIHTKTLNELQNKSYVSHFRGLVDLTGPIFDFMHRLMEMSAQAKNKKRKAIAPSGNKISFKRRIAYDVSHSGSKINEDNIKPSFENKITKKLREYYINQFKILIENNSYLKLDQHQSTLIAHNVEKGLIKQFNKAIEYEVMGDKASNVLF